MGVAPLQKSIGCGVSFILVSVFLLLLFLFFFLIVASFQGVLRNLMLSVLILLQSSCVILIFLLSISLLVSPSLSYLICVAKNGDCQPSRSLSLSPSVSLLQFVCLILYLAMCCNAVGVVCHSRFLPLVLVVCAECICSSVSPVSAVLVHFALLQFCHCVMVDWSDCTSPVPCNHPLCHLCCNTF